MRAMRTYAKKKECVNAPVGPFTTFSHCVYGRNIRNELISAAKSVGGDDPGAPLYSANNFRTNPDAYTHGILSKNQNTENRGHI